MADRIYVKDISLKSKLHTLLKLLTKYARKVLDSKGVPKKGFFFFDFFNLRKSGVRFSFRFLKPAEHGVMFDTASRECYLEPVDLSPIDDKYFIHRGIVKNKKFNNIDALCENKIFGDLRPNMPTYIAPISNSAIPTKNIFDTRQDVVLLIDKKTLTGLRKIYTDPEMLFLVIPGDKLGAAYFVLGGIPEIAIIGVSFTPSKGKAIFTLRNGRQVSLTLN